MPQGNARKIRTLFLRAEYLSAEVEDARELFDEYRGDFATAVASAVKALPPSEALPGDISSAAKELAEALDEVASEPNPDEDIGSSSKELPPDLKSLYRKIMVKVHPDKLTFIEDEDVCRRYSKLAKLANEAAENVDWYLMIKVANELSIELDSLSSECISSLEGRCDTLSSEVKLLHGSYQVHWGEAHGAAKSVWIKSYIENML